MKAALLGASALALIATTITTITTTSAVAQAPDRLVVFGDSSADLGTFGPTTRPTNQGEMWSERLGRQVGLTVRQARAISFTAEGAPVSRALGGTNYAINGATALAFDGVFTLKDQVDALVQDRGRFGANDLTLVWITRNDITTAAAAGIAYDPRAYATAFASEVDRMRRLGARDIVSFGAERTLLPRQYALDLGATPDQLAQLRTATDASEAALWPLLAARDVYILDIDRLAEDVRSSPARYGFRFTTDSYQGRGDPSPQPSQAYANDGNVFTADGHYTSAMQAVVGDFALAQLRGRAQFASAFATIGEELRLGTLRAAATAGDGLGAASGWRVYGGGAFEATRQPSAGRFDPRFEDDGYRVELGTDYLTADDLRFGVQVTASQRDGRFDGDTGGLDRKSAQVTLYAAKGFASGFAIDGAISAGLIQVDAFERRAQLGATAKAMAEGETEGSYLAARIGWRYAVDFGDLGLELGSGLSAERTRLDGFDDRVGVLALSYGDAEQDTARADVRGLLRFGRADGALTSHVAVGYHHDLLDDPLELEIGPTRSTQATFTSERPNRTGTSIELGAAYRVTAQTRLSGVLSLDRNDDGDEATGFRLVLSRAF